MPWTKKQQQAIDARETNLLISAAAGSGKTAVLVERIIRLIIDDKKDIDRMLIVTFTKAAAGEMRERIGHALMSAMNESSGKTQKHLKRQLARLGSASISTLHSFCMQLIKRYFYELELDPMVRIADEAETVMLEQEAIKTAMETLYTERNSDFMVLCDNYAGERSDRNIRNLVLNLYHQMLSHTDPFEWLKQSVEQYNLNSESIKKNAWYEGCMAYTQRIIDNMHYYIECGQALCELPNGPEAYAKTFEQDFELIEQLQLACNVGYDAFSQVVQNVVFSRLARCGKDADEELRDLAKAYREKAKAKFKQFAQNGLTRELKTWIEELHHMYPAMVGLEKIIKTFHEAFIQEKMERKVINYADLEHYSLQLLSDETIAHDVQKQYDFIFVDEYQDTNGIQEAIVSGIKRDNNLFMVGDIKQSIYRFRQADPSIFLNKYLNYSNKKPNMRIDLNKNFRSDQRVLEAINSVFRHLMSKTMGEMEYDDAAHLYAGMEYPKPNDIPVGLTVIELDKNNELDEQLASLQKEEIEACAVASAIEKVIGKPIYDVKKDCVRPVKYSDIAVLMRTVGSTAPVYSDIFKEWNIPAFADIQTGYFDSIEIMVFLNLLQVIDNGRRDLALLSVLRSDIVGLDERVLAEIRSMQLKGSFSEAFYRYQIEGKDEAIKAKINRFCNCLDKWREDVKNMPLESFIWMLFEETKYYDVVGAMAGGKQRKLNLEMLADKALQFEQTNLKGLFNFLRYIERIHQGGKDFGAAKTLSENDDVVRIMSIHKSKGLEFPIVFVAGLGRQFNAQDVRQTFIVHKELGLGAKYKNVKRHCTSLSFPQISIKQKMHDEMLAEELRILYVALTRAKNECHLVGTATKSRQLYWEGGTHPVHLLNAMSYLDWMGAYLYGTKSQTIQGDCLYEEVIEIDNTCWGYNRLTLEEVMKNMPQRPEASVALEAFERPCESQWIAKRLEWEYAYQASANVPTKLSVTEIKRLSAKQSESVALFERGEDLLALRELYLERQPAFMRSKKLSPVERGLAVHFAMQHFDLKGKFTLLGLKEQLAKMQVQGMMTKEQVDCVDIIHLEKFFKSALGKRMIKSSDVRRELPFNLVKKASQTSEQFQACEESVLIQGIIDCCFLEDDEWVLIDYKTDAVIEGREQEVANRYRVQIELYKEALVNITGKKVKESYIYLFSINKAVKVNSK